MSRAAAWPCLLSMLSWGKEGLSSGFLNAITVMHTCSSHDHHFPLLWELSPSKKDHSAMSGGVSSSGFGVFHPLLP